MKYHIFYIQERCTGCLRCQLACSRTYEKSFLPSAARIRIHTDDMDYAAEFTRECEECGFCADSCLFDALTKIAKEAAA